MTGLDGERPASAALLDAWERALPLAPPERVATLLAAVSDGPPCDASALTVGERDARLLALRERLFGSHLRAVATCEACGARLEFTLEIGDLRVERAGTLSPTDTLDVDGFTIRFRLPTTDDVARAAHERDLVAFRCEVLARCLLDVRHHGEPTAIEGVPAPILEAVVARMDELDPQADVQLALDCPDCETSWNAPFDIATFLWSEIDAWARRLLAEIHGLASAYGWSEREILSLSTPRRRFYLELQAAR